MATGKSRRSPRTGRTRPLEGLRVLELGQLIAGPWAGTILAYFGAEVIKIEPPGGDPIRSWRLMTGDTSVWWASLARNKKSVTLDLRREESRLLVRRLAAISDVLIESFRPGTMERWGLSPAELAVVNPRLIYARVSGYGQTGPYAPRPGYASVCEGVGGFRYVNGFPGQAPVRPNLSLGDTVTGIHAALGILLALYHGARLRRSRGQVVDVSIYESVFNLMEAVVPEYDRCGVVREPSGTTVTGIAPSNIYPCRDGKYVIIGGNGDSIFRRLMQAIERADLARDPALSTNAGRVAREKEIDAAISAWTGGLDLREVVTRLEAAAVPAGPIYSVADIMQDPHFHARGMFESVEVHGAPLKIPAIAPKLVSTPGGTEWPGPPLGAHNNEILCGLLGLTPAELQQLEQSGAVAGRVAAAAQAE